MANLKLYILIFAAAVVISGIVFFALRTPSSPSEGIQSSSQQATELANETQLALSAEQTFKFNLNGLENLLAVNSTSGNSAGLTLLNSKTVFTATFHFNETRTYDIDDSESADIKITLNGINEGKANLSIIRIICNENWNCGEWGTCSGGNQTRTCEDTNHCATGKSKPAETQECKTCTELAGTICEETEICNTTALSSKNGLCCLGKCIIKPPVLCSSIDCLISASESCDIANLTYSSVFRNVSGALVPVTYYYKIRGIKSEKCQLYTEITEVGTAQIELIGRNGICRFEGSYELPEYLTEVKDSNYQLTVADIASYECDGNLYV